MIEYAHVKGAKRYWVKWEKKEETRKRSSERKTVRKSDRSLCCIIWQGTSPVLSDGGVRTISHTHTFTHKFTFLLSLFLLVSLQSRHQPLADRTGPLGSYYRLQQQRDWKAQIAALQSAVPGKSLHISHRILTWNGGKKVKKAAKRKGRMEGRLHT